MKGKVVLQGFFQNGKLIFQAIKHHHSPDPTQRPHEELMFTLFNAALQPGTVVHSLIKQINIHVQDRREQSSTVSAQVRIH